MDRSPPDPDEARGPAPSDRFLSAFARTEEALQELLGTRNSFRWMVRQAAKRDPLVRSVEDDLIELGELRNAIVHERGGGYVIAEPHVSTVERLERIAELIADPPRIDEVMSAPVVTCAPADPVVDAARRMVDGGFSRLPVYDAEGSLLGLLTANAIARWVTTRLVDDSGALEAEPVGAVLGYGEAGRRFEIVDRHALVTDVVARFTEGTRQGRRVEAVLITPRGESTEPPVGIVTVRDLPRMYSLLGL